MNGRKILSRFAALLTAALVHELAHWAVLRRLGGWADWQMRRVRARLCGGFGKASPGRRLIRARVEGGCAYLTGSNHSSGSLAEMIGCNALIDIPAGSGPLGDGDDVEVLLL